MFGLVKMLQYLAIKRFGVQLDARMLSKQAGSALSYIFLGGFLTFQSWIELSTFGFDMFGAVLGLVGVALLAVQIYRVLKGK
jgi:hypothetical protein